MVIPDNYSQWEAHEREQEAWLEKRPVCSYCGEPIQDDELFDISGELYHIECAELEFKKCTEDYI
jgi:hypothetical protein